MNIALARILYLLRHELRLAWRQQLRLLGIVGTMLSPSIIVVLYLLLHVVFLILHFSSTPENASIHLGHIHSLILVGTLLVLLEASAIPAAEMIVGRFDWELILSSPFPTRAIIAFRLLSIAGRALILPILVMTPPINVIILNGNPALLLFYLALPALGLFVVGIITSLISMIPANVSPRESQMDSQL